MDIFDYNDYKIYVKEYVQGLPKGGRGTYTALAKLVSVSTVVISQIFKGSKNLTADQALAISEYLGHSDLEHEYFLALVNRERAGTFKLKDYYDKKLSTLKNESQQLAKQIKVKDKVPDEAKAIYYSDWIYVGLRMLSAVETLDNIDDLCEYTGLSRAKVSEVIQFLIKYGFVIEENKQLKLGKSSTHLDKGSTFLNNHHKNWRIKGLEKITEPEDIDLFYTVPMVLSVKDIEFLRTELVKLIANTFETIKKTKGCEQTMCLNIDYFKF